MNLNKSRYSLYTILSAIVVCVIFLIMSLFLTHDYFDTKEKLFKNLTTTSQTTLSRLGKSLLPFIESYSINEYENLILNEMSDKNIVAIMIYDYNMGTILGEEFFQSGKIRDTKWNPIDYKGTPKNIKILQNIFLQQETIVFSNNDTKLAKIEIYSTDRYIEEELENLITKSFFITLLISIMLIIFLVVSIKKLILNPISKIIFNISQRDDLGIPLKNIEYHHTKEIELLSSSLNEMIDTIKSSKERLLKLNERFELTLSAVNDGIWDWDVKTDKAFFSKRWKNMLGYEENEIEDKGKAFFELICDEDKEKTKKALENHFENPSKNPYNLEIRLKCKDDSYKWILSRGNIFFDKDGKPSRMLGFHTDRTLEKEQEIHQKAQEKLLQEQSKLASMGEMIGNIAHQWRQPLSIITTSASGLKMKILFNGNIDQEEIIKFSDLIVQQSQYLSETINNFRDFIKGDTQYEQISLKKAIEKSLNLVSSSLENNYIKLVVDIESDLQIYGNINELIEAFINIINNSKDALKYHIPKEDERILFINTKLLEKNSLLIQIKDNGGGIDENIIDKIFEPYFTTKHQSVGTGLGLSIADKIIRERHKGVITVSNQTYQYKGKNYTGACFKIVFK